MKVGTPTTEIPDISNRDNGKYAEIYKQVDKLSGDKWLPVEFDTMKRATNFRIAIETHRTRLMEATLRGRTVYVRNRQVPSAKQRGGK